MLGQCFGKWGHQVHLPVDISNSTCPKRKTCKAVNISIGVCRGAHTPVPIPAHMTQCIHMQIFSSLGPCNQT